MYVSVLSRISSLDLLTLASRLLSGYSRFPVHVPGDPTAFVGLLLVKKVRLLPWFEDQV